MNLSELNMARGNGKSEVNPAELDPEHELPPRDEEPGGDSLVPLPHKAAELEKLKAERDSLIDRLARLQAEFENARKRTAREQQEFREYAVADALKALLPTLDSFERALQTSASDKSEFREWSRSHLQAIAGCAGQTGTATHSVQG